MAHLKWIYHWKWWFSIATLNYQRVYHIISYLRSINLSGDLFLIYVRYWWWAPPFMELELSWEIRGTPRETMGVWGLGLGYPTSIFFRQTEPNVCIFPSSSWSKRQDFGSTKEDEIHCNREDCARDDRVDGFLRRWRWVLVPQKVPAICKYHSWCLKHLAHAWKPCLILNSSLFFFLSHF